MATHSSILAWEIPYTEEPCGIQSMGSQRVRHDLATKLPPPHSIPKDIFMIVHAQRFLSLDTCFLDGHNFPETSQS